MSITVALLGNPNSGKTTLFNKLTKSKGHVGNWPGVTFDRKEGQCTFKDETFNIVDLPGIYSLAPYSPEEIVSRNYLLEEKPDIILNIVDITNLERNLYLTTQLMEINCPIVVALNMIDIFQKQDNKINIKQLSDNLQLPVVDISASNNTGLDKLLQTIYENYNNKRKATTVLSNFTLGKYIKELNDLHIRSDNQLFYTIDALESLDAINGNNSDKFVEIKKKAINDYNGLDMEAVIADLRYQYIIKYCSSLITKLSNNNKETLSNKIDKILTNRFLGLPIFLLIMYFMFHVTFSENFLFIEDLSSPGMFLKDFVEDGVDNLGTVVAQALDNIGAAPWQTALISDGIFAGLGAVFSYLPQILILFLFLSILEDSGYMSRASFVIDKLFKSMGLSGKSFIPMLMGFGCSVPAMMASRTIENEKNRIMTILMVPFMSCGAKLPIYTVIISAFFKGNVDVIIFGIYLLGLVVAILSCFLLKNTILKDSDSTYIMEMPPYRMPNLTSLLSNLWEKTKGFITKAGTILMSAIIVIWFLSNFDLHLHLLDEPNSKESILGVVGNGIKFIFAPLGFAQGEEGWKFVSAVLSGFIAKESVITTLGQLFSTNITSIDDAPTSIALTHALQNSMTTTSAISFAIYNLLTIPCVAAVSTMYKELSKKYFVLAVLFQLIISWIVTFIVYNIVSLIL